MLNPDATLYITGGKSTSIKEQVMQKCVYIEEFEAVTKGARFLVKRENPSFQDDFILVSLGTGTSIFHVKEEESYRLLGSGIGGGTLMGLGSLLTGRGNYQHLINLAEKGSSQKVIYWCGIFMHQMSHQFRENLPQLTLAKPTSICKQGWKIM